MIEKPELTLNILQHFARDDVPYPSNLDPTDLHAAFSDQKPADIDYSIICAIQAGLLDGNISDASTMEGRNIVISSMDGLSQQGGEYVRNAEKHYGKAVKILHDIGQNVTTSSVSEMVNRFVQQAIQGAMSL